MNKKNNLPFYLIAGSIIAVIFLCIIGGLIATGSPTQARLYRLDNARLNDLQQIESMIRDFTSQYKTLPTSTLDIDTRILSNWAYQHIPVDPETGESYEYNKLGENTFELCANFRLSSTGSKKSGQVEYSYVGKPGLGSWNHEAGKHCFTRTVSFVPIPVDDSVMSVIR